MSFQQMIDANVQLVIPAKDLADMVKDFAREVVRLELEAERTKSASEDAEPFMTVKQVARMLNRSEKSIRAYCRDGILRYKKTGHNLDIYKSSVLGVIENQKSNY